MPCDELMTFDSDGCGQDWFDIAIEFDLRPIIVIIFYSNEWFTLKNKSHGLVFQIAIFTLG